MIEDTIFPSELFFMLTSLATLFVLFLTESKKRPRSLLDEEDEEDGPTRQRKCDHSNGQGMAKDAKGMQGIKCALQMQLAVTWKLQIFIFD